MGRRGKDGSETRFAAYVEGLASVMGHADRAGLAEAYCMGLILPAERKSVDPPLRTERHIPNSITTMRRRLIVALVRRLQRCPCCAVHSESRAQRSL
jgi:SRSO17 transposase